MKIAVISDLHCDTKQKKDENDDSYLLIPYPRVPAENHPVQALIKLIKSEQLRADIIICPGDLSNKICSIGFHTAWDYLRNDISIELKVKELFCTLGNHDVNARKLGVSPFEIAKDLHPDYPFKESKDKDSFWSRGYCLNTFENANILTINSTHDYYGSAKAKRGTFDITRITDLDNLLRDSDLKDLRIAFLHHHPILHSHARYDSSDILPTGDQLLKALSSRGFQFIIHGHRHQPRITRQQSSGFNFHVFCAGSFSGYLRRLSTVTRNTFHLIELILEDGKCMGIIKTWEFNDGIGWSRSSTSSTRFPHKVNIGPVPPSSMSDDIIDYFTKNSPDPIGYTEAQSNFPFIDWLLPEEIEFLNKQLLDEGRVKLSYDLFGEIKEIGKVKW